MSNIPSNHPIIPLPERIVLATADRRVRVAVDTPKDTFETLQSFIDDGYDLDDLVWEHQQAQLEQLSAQLAEADRHSAAQPTLF